MADTPLLKAENHEASCPVSNPPRALSPELTRDPTHRRSPRRIARLREIFPPGLDPRPRSKRIEQPYTFSPEQLREIFSDYHSSGDPRGERVIVKSAWYGKQTKGALHEFIVIQVEDLMIPGLNNWIALDRNQGFPASTAFTRFLNTLAWDAFRVSYDGGLDYLLRDSQLTPYLQLEEIYFQPNEPLLLLDLVELVSHVSDRYPRYRIFGTNFLWFAGLIWECILQMRPTAKHEVQLRGPRGRLGFLRSNPNPLQVWNTLREVYAKRPNAESSR